MELGCHYLATHPLGFVDCDQYPLGGPSQFNTDLEIVRGQTFASVHKEDHTIGFEHRLPRLTRHLDCDAFARHRLEPAAVDNDELALTDSASSVLAIACKPGYIRYQRCARARETIE
jgi:hypothetical protein